MAPALMYAAWHCGLAGEFPPLRCWPRVTGSSGIGLNSNLAATGNAKNALILAAQARKMPSATVLIIMYAQCVHAGFVCSDPCLPRPRLSLGRSALLKGKVQRMVQRILCALHNSIAMNQSCYRCHFACSQKQSQSIFSYMFSAPVHLSL